MSDMGEGSAYWRQQKRIEQLEEELRLTDRLLESREQVLKAIPACLDHGHSCVPHAIEWVQGALVRIEQLERELAEAKRPNFREMREMLRAMQAGELTVSRGVELLEIWYAGNYSDDMLPPVRQDLIEEDSMPVEIIDRLKSELAALKQDRDEWKEATICANERFKIAEKNLATLKAQLCKCDEHGACAMCSGDLKAQAQEPVAWLPSAEWTACTKLPLTVHVRAQRPGETHVSTREGITPIKPDDLIMRGVSGEEYPIGREIFDKTYRIGDAPPPNAEDAQIFELYEQALKASWPEGAMGDAFDYWNQARIARGEGK